MSFINHVGICLIAALLPATYAEGAYETQRPPLSSACSAWREHIAVLLNEHRFSLETDDEEFGRLIGRFYDAQEACGDSQRLAKGIALYERLAISPVSKGGR